MIYFGALIFVLIVAATGIRLVNQYERHIVLRLGKYHKTLQPGFNWIIPFIDRASSVDIRTITASVDQQETITKDNVPVKITAVAWYTVIDPAKAVLKVESAHKAVMQVALTSLRNTIGRYTLDDVLKDQIKIAKEMRDLIDTATEPWGVNVERVEMRNVEIPESMQRAMAQEAEALREKRARIIKAEAELEASIKLKEAAKLIMENPAGLELRRFQMITEVGAEQNTTTIIMMPSEFVSMARGIAQMAERFVAKESQGLSDSR